MCDNSKKFSITLELIFDLDHIHIRSDYTCNSYLVRQKYTKVLISLKIYKIKSNLINKITLSAKDNIHEHVDIMLYSQYDQESP